MARHIYRSADHARGIDTLTMSDFELLRKIPGSEVVLETHRIMPEPETYMLVSHLKPEQVTFHFSFFEEIGATPGCSNIYLHGDPSNTRAAEKRVIEYLRANKPAPIPQGRRGYRKAQTA